MGKLKVGAGKIEITPSPGNPMAGYAARIKTARGAHDPLYARVVVFDDGMSQFVLVVLDLLKVEAEFVGKIRAEISARTGIGPEVISVLATHTHAGPRIDAGGGQEYNPKLAPEICLKVGRAAAQARQNCIPVKMGFASTTVCGLAGNRIDPEGFHDPAVGIIEVEDMSGNPLVFMVNYACHPTVLGAENLFYTRDFPGYTTDLIEQAYPESMAVFCNGAAANISTRYTKKAANFNEAERLGGLLAKKVLARVREGLITDHEWEIAVKGIQVDLQVKTGISRENLTAMLDELQKKIKDLWAKKAPRADIRRLETDIQGIETALRRCRREPGKPWSGGKKEKITTEVQVISFISKRSENSLVLVMLPGEIAAEIGYNIKKELSALRGIDHNHVYIAGYAGDHIGYMLPPAIYGEINYETLVSRLSPAAGQVLAEKIILAEKKGMAT